MTVSTNKKRKKKKRKIKRISRIHDRFFKQVFSYPDIVYEFIQKTFPPEVVKSLNLNTLVNDTNSYIDKNLIENFSDLVYTVETNEGKILKLALLFEHKSQYVEYPQFQLLTYITKIWADCDKQNKNKILVIPIIFYHGVNTWIIKPLDEYFEGISDQIKRFVPKIEYILIDISALSDDKIKVYGQYELRASLFLFKYVFDNEELKRKFEDFFNANQKLNTREEEFIVTFIEYLRNNLKKEDMEIVIDKIRNNVATTNIFVRNFKKRYLQIGAIKGERTGVLKGEIIGIQKGEIIGIQKGEVIGVQKGERKGKKKSIAKLILDSKYSPEEIAALFNVKTETVHSIKNIIDKTKHDRIN